MSLHLSTKLKTLAESTTIRLNAAARALKSSGVEVYNLTVGELDFETPIPIRNAVTAHLRENKYTHTLGMAELRSRIAECVNAQYGLAYTSDHIAVTAGAKQALSNIFTVILNPRDEVIIPTPSWVSYEHQVALAGGVPVFVPLSRTFDLDVKAIERAITTKTKAIILNSPHNPTGAVFSRRALTALARLLARHELYVIADDIYNTLCYTDEYTPLSTLLPTTDTLIIVNGFSKSHALTGWRVGYIAASPSIIEATNRLQSHISGNAAVMSQYAALAALDTNSSARFLTTLTKRRALVASMLDTIPTISYTLPGGAFYFFIDVRKVDAGDVRFAERLLREAHVAVVPGDAFRAPGFIRLSFAADTATLQKALRAFARFMSTYHTAP